MLFIKTIVKKESKIMSWIVTIASIVGVILNIRKNKLCFLIWSITNFSWMVIDFYYKLYSQSALFAVYFILAIYGLWKWEKDEKRKITKGSLEKL